MVTSHVYNLLFVVIHLKISID